MKSRRQKKNRKNSRRKIRKGGQYLSNVGWSTGYDTMPKSNIHSSLANPVPFSRTTTNWV